MSPRVAADWFGAQTNCSTYNAHLVTVSSRSENSFLIREFITKQHKSRHFWIGLQRAPFDDSIWVWVDGSRLTFRDWYSGQPDNYRQEEYCGEMYVLYVRSGVVKWNDLNCSQASRFICEKGKPCCSFFFFFNSLNLPRQAPQQWRETGQKAGPVGSWYSKRVGKW